MDSEASEAHYYIFRYSALRNKHGTLNHLVQALRNLIAKAARHKQLTAVQRDELLKVVDKIDGTRRMLEGEMAGGQRDDGRFIV